MNGRNSDGGNWSQIALKSTLENVEPAGRIKKVLYICRGDEKKECKEAPSLHTSFSTVISPTVDISPLNFLTFSFKPFPKLLHNFCILSISPNLLNWKQEHPSKKSIKIFSAKIVIKLKLW